MGQVNGRHPPRHRAAQADGTGGRTPTAQQRRTVTLPPDPSSPGRARQVLRQVLTDTERLDCLDAAELACTELVTNAVLHAHTPIDVTVEVTHRVWVGVRDRSVALPLSRHYDRQATTGRGLALVAALTDEHGVADAGADGKTVWFTVGGGPGERSEDELLMAWAAADWDLLDVAPSPAPATPTRTVRLLALPSALWLAARQHHDALLRELALYVARNPDVTVDAVAADRARFTVSGAVAAAVEAQRRVAGADRPDSGAADSGADTSTAAEPRALWIPVPIDLTLEIAPSMARDFSALQDTLDTAERLARDGALLARPGLPEIVAVRDWACDQIVAQLAGVAPAPWPGTDEDRTRRPPDEAGRAEQLDLAPFRTSSRGVAVADESNRMVAVSAPLARLLGWRAEDLVGRRVTALVPARLREAHVAGFTRHQSTGETRVVGTPLTVPVLRADGTEVRCRLLIERAVDTAGRSLYAAWIDPVDPAGPAEEGTPA